MRLQLIKVAGSVWDDKETDYNYKSLQGPIWSNILAETHGSSSSVCMLVKNDYMRNSPGYVLTPVGFRSPSIWSKLLPDSYFHSLIL